MLEQVEVDMHALEALAEELRSDMSDAEVTDICDRAQPYAKRLLQSGINPMQVRDILSIFTPYLRRIGRLG